MRSRVSSPERTGKFLKLMFQSGSTMSTPFKPGTTAIVLVAAVCLFATHSARAQNTTVAPRAGVGTAGTKNLPASTPNQPSTWGNAPRSSSPTTNGGWGGSKTTFGQRSANWNSGSASFGMRAQPGGIWRSQEGPKLGAANDTEGAMTLSQPTDFSNSIPSNPPAGGGVIPSLAGRLSKKAAPGPSLHGASGGRPVNSLSKGLAPLGGQGGRRAAPAATRRTPIFGSLYGGRPRSKPRPESAIVGSPIHTAR